MIVFVWEICAWGNVHVFQYVIYFSPTNVTIGLLRNIKKYYVTTKD